MTNVNNQMQERELGWDDEISQESTFILLPEGEYFFKVTKFERARHTPKQGGKMPACNMAKLTLAIQSKDGEVTLNHNLFLHSKTEGLLSAFFISIGQKKKGEPLRMNWNQVIGASGKALVEINEYTGNDGQLRKNNQVKRFLEPAGYGQSAPSQQPSMQQPSMQQPTYQAPPVQSQQQYQQPQQGFAQQPNGFTPGAF